DVHAPLAQLRVRRGDVLDLEPQPDRRGRRRVRAARQLQEPAAEEVHGAPLGTGAELAVHGEPEPLAVEDPGPLGIGGTEEDASAQYVHHAAERRGRASLVMAEPRTDAAKTHRATGEATHGIRRHRSPDIP